MANKNVTIKRWNTSTWDVVYPKTTIANVANLSSTLADMQSDIDDATIADLLVKVTWQELKNLRDAGELVPGLSYRIIDYVTTTVQDDTQSAGHAFDLIVVADSVDKLNEQARAIQHDGDSYFANSKLEAWQVWYSLDNDTNRFAWADEENGKGVIYRMIDEFNNDVPYDFKNIQFKKANVWYYTFADDIKGASYSNKISRWISDNATLNAITFGDKCFSNTFGNGCYNNTFGNYCYNNTFGNYCNNITFGDGCYNITFGDSCINNTFGKYCYYITFGNGCYNNTFGNYCFNNTFGNGCFNNTFGESCYKITFGDNCNNNTFGKYCSYNTFGNGCYNNTFGDSCNNNTFGNDCNYNKITGDNVRYISVDNGLRGASSANQLELYDSAIANNMYQVSFKQASSGRYLMLWATDTGTMTGKYKAAATDVSWTAL